MSERVLPTFSLSQVEALHLVLVDLLFTNRSQIVAVCEYVARSKGCKPQEARDILPLATATTVMYTAFLSDWEHFFELRTSAGAHPDARAIAIPLMEEFKKLKLL